MSKDLRMKRHFLGGYPIPRAAGTKAQYVWEKTGCWRTASGLDITEVRCIKLGGEWQELKLGIIFPQRKGYHIILKFG